MNELRALPLLKQTLSEWVDDKAPTYAASLAYYAVFSIAPILLIALAVSGWLLGPNAVNGEVESQLTGFVGSSIAGAVQAAMVSAAIHSGGGFASFVGVIVLIFAATGVFGELQAALNTIFKARPRTTNTLLAFLRTRAVAFAMVMGIGALLLFSLMLSTAIAALGTWLGGYEPRITPVWGIVNLVASQGAVTVLFAMMFKILPDIRLEWRDVWLGAFCSAVLFNLGKLCISLYLTHSAIESSYGAAGSLAALLVWVYFSSMILLFGAELAQVYARTRGSLQGRQNPNSRRTYRMLTASAFDAWRIS